MDKKRDKQPNSGTKRRYLAACTFDDEKSDVDVNEMRETFHYFFFVFFFFCLIDSKGVANLAEHNVFSWKIKIQKVVL